MQAIELEIDIAEDGSLHLPECYRQWFGQHAKLILLASNIETSDNKKGQKMADALAKIAEQGGTGITDPVAWQRDIRHDRILLGRK